MSESTWICQQCKLVQPDLVRDEPPAYELHHKCEYCGGKRWFSVVADEIMIQSKIEELAAREKAAERGRNTEERIRITRLNVDRFSNVRKDAVQQRSAFIIWHVLKQYPVDLLSPENVSLRRDIKSLVRKLAFSDDSGVKLSSVEKNIVLEKCLDHLLGLGPLEPLLRDPEIEEIAVYSPKKVMAKIADDFFDSRVAFDGDHQLEEIGAKIVEHGTELEKEGDLSIFQWNDWKVAIKDNGGKEGPLISLSFEACDSHHDLEELVYPGEAEIISRSNVNEDLIRQKRQFISSKIQKEFPNLVDEDEVGLHIRARKRMRQLISQDSLGSYEQTVLLVECLDEIFGFGPLGPLLRTPEMKDVLLYSADKAVMRDEQNVVRPIAVNFDSDDHMNRMIQRLVGHLHSRSTGRTDRDLFVLGNLWIVLRQRSSADKPVLIISSRRRESYELEESES